MSDATSIDQWICMALCNRSAHKGCPQPTWQSLEHQSRCSAFWLITKAVVFDQMRGERMVFSTMHAALLLLPMSDRSLSAVYKRRSKEETQNKRVMIYVCQ